MAATRMVSLGSIMAAVLFPVLTLFIHENYLVVPKLLFLYKLRNQIVYFNS